MHFWVRNSKLKHVRKGGMMPEALTVSKIVLIAVEKEYTRVDGKDRLSLTD